MTQYLLTIYQSDDGAPDPTSTARIESDLRRLNDELRESGSRVFTGGLHAADTAAVVRPDGMISDGPYLDGTEHVGGIWIIDASDLDAALEWGRRAAAATTLPIEVRPFHGREPF